MFFAKKPWTYLHGILLAFGPVWALIILDWKHCLDFLKDRQYQAIYLVGLAGLAWAGGTDTERIFFWAAPVIYGLLGRAVERLWPRLLAAFWPGALLAVSQAISQRLFWTLPDPDWSSPVDRQTYFNLYSYFAERPAALASLFGNLLVIVLIVSWFAVQSLRKREPAAENAQPPPARGEAE